MRHDETGFAEFYRASYQRCLRAVIAGAGRPDLAEDLVAEAFTRAPGSELYIANGPLGPQPAVIPQGHYQGCA